MLNRRVFALSTGLVAWLGLSGCDPSKHQFVGIDITGADYAKGFRLPDQNGKIRTLDEFKGKVVVVFFGYTQ